MNQKQNLISNVGLLEKIQEARKEKERVIEPAGFYKSIVLDALTVFSALVVGYVYKLYLLGGTGFLIVTLSIAVFALFSLFEALLQRSPWRRVSVLVLQIVVLLSFFYNLPYKFLALAALVVFVLLSWGEERSRAELQNELEIRFFKVVKPQLSKLTTAMILFAIILYLPGWNPDKSFLPEKIFQSVFNSLSETAKSFYPEIRFNSSLEEFAVSVAELNLNKNPDFLMLNPASKKKVLEQTTDEMTSRLGKIFGIDALKERKEPLGSVLYKFLFGAFKQWQGNLGNLFLAVWIIAMFFILRAFGAIFRLVVAIIAFLVYHGLLSLNVIRIRGESQMHEVVEYS
jgi:hypothetical protein